MILTNSDPDGDVFPAAKVAHEDDREDVADLVRGSDEARVTRGDFETFLDGGDDRADVARGESLLQCDQQRQQQHKHLNNII